MNLLDTTSVRDVIIHAFAFGMDGNEETALLDYLCDTLWTQVDSEAPFDPDANLMDVNRETCITMFEQARTQVPQWLEEGRLIKQQWCMEGMYTNPLQIYGSDEIAVVQFNDQPSHSPRNIGLRYAAYLNKLVESNGGDFNGDDFQVETESRAYALYIVTEPVSKRCLKVASEQQEDILPRVRDALEKDGITFDPDTLIVTPLDKVMDIAYA